MSQIVTVLQRTDGFCRHQVNQLAKMKREPRFKETRLMCQSTAVTHPEAQPRKSQKRIGMGEVKEGGGKRRCGKQGQRRISWRGEPAEWGKGIMHHEGENFIETKQAKTLQAGGAKRCFSLQGHSPQGTNRR